jgi:hypothetical protein
MAYKLIAGVARADITPPIGVAYANWGAQRHQRARGIDLPLWATALALSDGETKLVTVDLDAVYGRNAVEMREATAELTGLPLSHIRLSYTHTHSGPSGGRWIADGMEAYKRYQAGLVHQVAGVAWRALESLRPACIAAGSGTARIGVNRRFQRPEDGAVICGRNWEGPLDPEVKVLRIDHEQGEPLATVVHYACHGTTVGPDNDLITPDFPGVVRRVVEQATGSMCLFLQGAAGNVQNTRGGAQGGIQEYRRLGAILGHEASRVWWELEIPERRERYVGTLESGAPLAIYEDEHIPCQDGPLRVIVRTIQVPLKSLPNPGPIEERLKRETARLNKLRAAGASDEAIREQTMVCKRIDRRATTARRFEGKTQTELELQGFAIGDGIALIAMPGEAFVQIGMAVKRNSPFDHTLFSSYTNDPGGYMPTADAYPLGGYEVERTPYSPEAADLVIEESLDLLKELAEQAKG